MFNRKNKLKEKKGWIKESINEKWKKENGQEKN